MSAIPHDPARVDPVGELSDLVKLAVDLRLVLLAVAMLFPLIGGSDGRIVVAMVGAALLGLVLLLAWHRIAAVLLRHPSLFLIDIGLTVALLAATGDDGPFVLYAIGTAFLAGVLYGLVGGAVYGATIASAQGFVVLWSPPDGVAVDMTFITLVGVPVLILVAGLGAASIRRLLLHNASVEADLEVAVQTAAVADERARLAREMHDTLGKTLHGIALSAAALPQYLARHPEQAASQAAQVASAAETASKEARLLMSDLRSDRLDMPLEASVEQWSAEWAARTGLGLELDIGCVGAMSASTRYELFTILREALRNVEAHAGADRVVVQLEEAEGMVRLVVQDDGCGLRCTDLSQLAADGHYGMVGMSERAARAGGSLAIRSRGRGTTIRAEVPSRSAHDMVRPPAEVA